jgi:hypothetical protein
MRGEIDIELEPVDSLSTWLRTGVEYVHLYVYIFSTLITASGQSVMTENSFSATRGNKYKNILS